MEACCGLIDIIFQWKAKEDTFETFGDWPQLNGEAAVFQRDSPDQRVMELTETVQKQTSDTWISKQTTCKKNVSAVFQPRGIKVLLFSILRKMPSVQMGRITPTVAIKYVLTVLSRLIRRNSNIQTNPTGAANTEMNKCCDHKNMWRTSPLPVNSREKEMPRKSDGYQQLVGFWYKRRGFITDNI